MTGWKDIDINEFKRDAEKLTMKEILEKYHIPPSIYYYLLGRAGLEMRRGRRKLIINKPKVIVRVQLFIPKKDDPRKYTGSKTRSITIRKNVNVDEIAEYLFECLKRKGWVDRVRRRTK